MRDTRFQPGLSHTGVPLPRMASGTALPLQESMQRAAWLGLQATGALLDEVRLTPKPALVDGRSSGAHHDASLPMYERSAKALEPFLTRMALAVSSVGDPAPTIRLRELAGTLGRSAEQRMLAVTGGVNTHRGSIWALGLLVAAAAFPGAENETTPQILCARAAALAGLPDRHTTPQRSHGIDAFLAHGAMGARGEALAGFPHVWSVGLPVLRARRSAGLPESWARLDALLAIMSSLEDTCLLHRGGRPALQTAQRGAADCLSSGGSSVPAGRAALHRLEQALLAHWASPGGSADLLAATLFLDRVLPEVARA